MSTTMSTESLITQQNLRAYFYDAILQTARKQHLIAQEATFSYLINLLTLFSNSGELFQQTEDGLQLKPLALFYADAVAANSELERQKSLRRLGDIALFISGMFSYSLRRKLVDVDYYIAMGGNAYAYIANNNIAHGWDDRVFSELSEKFVSFVDLLMAISATTESASHQDLLRFYELWMKTGSRYAAEQLQRFGITPSKAGNSLQVH